MTRLRAGKLRHRVAIKRPASGRGTRGERTGEDFVVSPEEFASIETLSGREAERARAVYAEATYRVEMRIRPGIEVTENDYLQHGTRRFHIGHVDDVDQRGIKYELLCAELK
jgi:SPP1 family predicted phage head-tail adaptor